MTVVAVVVAAVVGGLVGAVYVYAHHVLPAITAAETLRQENVRLRARLDAWERATGGDT